MIKGHSTPTLVQLRPYFDIRMADSTWETKTQRRQISLLTPSSN